MHIRLRRLRLCARSSGAYLVVLAVSTGLFSTLLALAGALVFRTVRLKGLDRLVPMSGLAECGCG
jgi:hypothetical protein